MSTQHTPGPWVIRRERDPENPTGWIRPHYWMIEQDCGDGAGGRWIAQFPHLVPEAEAQQIADAHLIAAAPTLLAALEAAERELCALRAAVGSGLLTDQTIGLVQAAIAIATAGSA